MKKEKKTRQLKYLKQQNYFLSIEFFFYVILLLLLFSLKHGCTEFNYFMFL